MTPAGWIFLALSWGVVIIATVTCFVWTLDADEGSRNFPTA